jgi:hypothetical protein
MKLIYRETFDKGPGGWTVGKNKVDGEYHRNIFGHRGTGAALGWSPTGGRSSPGHAYSASPWYFDDNHGQFMWFHLALRVPTTEEIGIGGVDLRGATMRIVLRGRDLELRGTRLYFWIQGRRGAKPGYYTGDPLVNWALTSRPVERALSATDWTEESFELVDDETKWRQIGLINGGLARKIRVVQSLTMADGALTHILGGLHWNFGFVLGPLDPNELPTGRIEVDEVTITAAEQKGGRR